jgi:polysaccharide biosynthesis transport protein
MTPHATAGLIDAISGTMRYEDVICTDPETGLHFLPTVIDEPIAHTSELLASASMRNLIEALSKQYDYVIVDLSPLAPIIDVRSTGHFI